MEANHVKLEMWINNSDSWIEQSPIQSIADQDIFSLRKCIFHLLRVYLAINVRDGYD